MGQYLIADIETIRHPGLWKPKEQAAWRISAEMPGSDQEITGTIAKPERDFAPAFAWRPVVIGCVLLDVSHVKGKPVTTIEKIGVIDVPKEGRPADEWERELLEAFSRTMIKREADLVTWNGRQFDVPVLMLRSLRYGIACPWYYQNREARKRYTEDGHCDLADQLSDNGATWPPLALDGVARMAGLPGKYGDIDGAGVEAAFAAGRHYDIGSYCLADAVQTAFLFLRWQLLKGNVAIEEYRAVTAELLAKVAVEPRLNDFVSRVDHKVLLLERDAAPPATEAA